MRLLSVGLQAITNISMSVALFIPKQIELTYMQQQELYSEEFEDDCTCIYSRDINANTIYEFYIIMNAFDRCVAPMFYTNIDQVYSDVKFYLYGKEYSLPYRVFMKYVRRQKDA